MEYCCKLDCGLDPQLMRDIDHAKDHLEGVLEALYETGEVGDLESHLEEVCAALDVPFAAREPLIKNMFCGELKCL